LRQRADVRAAEYKVNAATALASQADAARLPSLQLGGTLGLKALTLTGLVDGSSVLRTLFARMTMPLLDGGAGSARQRAQQAALEQEQASYRISVLGALKEVEDALVALRTDRLRLVSMRLAAESAANASLMANQRFQSGLVDFQIVLETQRSRLSTQDSVAAAYAAVSADHVRLYKALGGGWESENRINEL
jgi:outer membrane protein TolC